MLTMVTAQKTVNPPDMSGGLCDSSDPDVPSEIPPTCR